MKRNHYIFIIIMLTLLPTALHFTAMREFSSYVVLEEFYYLPLLLGALRFGLTGAVMTWLFVSTAYIPFFLAPWSMGLPAYFDRSLHLILSAVIALVVGILIDRERRNNLQAEKDQYLAVIGRVSTVIVHDLKNPLISITGFARRISEGKGDSVKAARTILDSAHIMQRIVNEVLDFAKPMQLELVKCDVRETVSHAVEICRTKAAGRDVALKVTFPDDPLINSIDTVQVERALVNLIDNAVEATPGGGEVIIAAGLDKRGSFVTIKDYGEGMESETLAHLFEPFYTTKSDGTGLGMPIARKICVEHGGSLVISSKRGVGTEATVRLTGSKKHTRYKPAQTVIRASLRQ
jgi:signal transduction histidine kinase